MTDTEQLFPDLVVEVPERLPVPCAFPFFVVAYRPNVGGWGERWKIHWPLEFSKPNHPRLLEQIAELQAKGWKHVQIMRLPIGDYPWHPKA